MHMKRTNNKVSEPKNARKRIGLNTKLIGLLIPIIAVALAAILLLVYANTSNIILSKSEESLQLGTDSAVNNVKAWMNRVLTALEQQRDALEFFDASDEEAELNYIKHTAKQYDAFPAGIYIGLKDGSLRHASFVPGPEYNVFEKPWYNDGLKSEPFILGAIYFDEDSQSYVVGASGVLKSKSGVVRGVAAADIYLDDISKIVSEVKLEETGGLFLVDKDTGMIIGHKDPELLGGILSEQSDPMYNYVATLLSAGTLGLQTFTNNGVDVYLDMEDVPGSRWAAVSYVPGNEVMADLNSFTRLIIAIAVCSILILMVLIIVLLRRVIIRPVRQIDTVARHIAQGNLDESIEYRSGDELGELADNFNQTVDRLRDYVNYINEISTVLEDIAAGNLNFRLTYDYAGEFEKVKHALEHISLSLNDTIGAINQSAEQVSSGAEQVSSGAMALSQGTSQQAASVEELAATIGEVAQQVRETAERALQANERVDTVGKQAKESNQRMQDMLTSMHEISTSSSEIGKIMKTIEDIAFQTNILALNAAVEAARAGAAGKGFAVVADEVRNLANKSQEASKNTGALISNSLRATENGARIADETAAALALVVEGVEEVSATITKISQASSQQAQSVSQVDLGVDQISAVVQTNSATAEESAAASETLSMQADTMKQLVGRFRLKD